MINQNELYEALMHGADPEKMANDYAAMLNAAIDQKKAEEARIQKEKEAAAKAKEAAAQAKAASNVLNTVKAYATKYYPQIDLSTFTVEDLDSIFESSIKAHDTLKGLNDMFSDLFGNLSDVHDIKIGEKATPKNTATVKANASKSVVTPRDPIEAFLRQHGLV